MPIDHVYDGDVQAVLVPSKDLKGKAYVIRGYDFNEGRSLDGLMESMLYSGCQASNLGKAINEVQRMVKLPYPRSSL